MSGGIEVRMSLKKVAVIGHFGGGKNFLDGQTVKTKILATELERRYSADEVLRIDTYGGKKTLFTIPFKIWRALRHCENVIILPAHNGLRVIAPLLAFENLLFKRRLHYSVIGGWLAGHLKKRKIVARSLRRFHGIYVETSTMKNALVGMGYSNVKVVPNCKELYILSDDEIISPTDEPYKLCTFSRVMREKGIGDAVDAVRAVNKRYGRVVFTLDIYGQVDAGQVEWFDSLKQSFPDYVRYGGLVPFDKSVEVLREYFALLFPTRFFTEGIPGTIIDAYAAALPVISARWESFSDMVEDGVTGIGYELGNYDALEATLAEIAETPELINKLRKSCAHRAEDYLPRNAVSILADELM